ncbi:MAG: hypothetical protein EBS05_03895, partial [Proteobacteria bacterium]|nr:hypothetical protein [Pseudomonadota bacterium]
MSEASGRVVGWLLTVACFWLATTGLLAQTISFLPGQPVSFSEGATNAVITIIRSPVTGTASVSYFTTNGTATAGADYVAVSGTLFFNNGEGSKTVTIPILQDTIAEPTETFFLVLTNQSGASLSANVLQLSILDDDTFFQFSSPTYSVSEGATNAVLTVLRTGGAPGAASVDVVTSDITATNGLDYTNVSLTLSFATGQTQANVSISIVDDFLIEGSETFRVSLTNAVGAAISGGSAIVTILDNDGPGGTLGFAVFNQQVDEGTNVVITVTRTGSTVLPVSVDVVVLNPNLNPVQPVSTNAIYGIDYNLTSGRGGTNSAVVTNFTVSLTLVFPAGSGFQTFTLNALNDTAVEVFETVLLSLQNATNGAVIDPPRSLMRVDINFNQQPPGAADRQYNFSSVINPNPGANNAVYATAAYTNRASTNFGKVIIVGDFTAVNSNVRNRVARLNPDGSLDGTFDPGTGADDAVFAVAIQPDEKVLIAGRVASYNSVGRAGVARINNDGSLDGTFDPGTGADAQVTAMALQTDGNIVLAGNFTHFNSIVRNGLVRLTTAGAVDISFDAGAGPNGTVYALGLSPNLAGTQTIYLGGDFTSVAGVPRPRVARLLPTGGVDGAFAPASGPDNTVFALLPGASSLMIGGAFTSYNQVARGGLARLNLDGSLDLTFYPGTGVVGSVYSISLQTNGQPVIGGEFISYNGTPRTNLARLYGNGVLDTSFLERFYNETQPGPNGSVQTVNVLPSGNVMIGGVFTLVGGGFTGQQVLPRYNVAQLIGGDILPVRNMAGNIGFSTNSFTIDENVVSGAVAIRLHRANGELGQVIASYQTVDGTAVAGRDYVSASGLVSWADSDTIVDRLIFVPIIDNKIVDGNRAFTIKITSVTSGGWGTDPALDFLDATTVTIVDDDSLPGVLGFSAPFYRVDESVGNATVTVNRTNGSVGAVSVQYATSPGTATPGADYSSRSGTLTFASGQTSRTFTVPILNDTIVEFEESILLNLTSPSGGATLGLTNSMILIESDDGGPGSIGFLTNQFVVAEASGRAVITVIRTSGTTGTATVDLLTYDLPPASSGVARAGLDYTTVSNRLTFATGVATQTVVVPITVDRLVEGDESFGVRLTNVTGGANLGVLSNVLVVVQDANSYGSLSLTSTNYVVNERTNAVYLTVVRSGGDTDAVSVQYYTTPGSAVAGVRYVATNGTLVFPDLVTTQYIVVPIIQDVIANPAETFLVTLSNFVKAAAGPNTNAVITVYDQQSLAAAAGTVDTSFDTSAASSGSVNAIALQSGNKLVIGGSFTNFNGIPLGRIARVNDDGTVDQTFLSGSGANAVINSIVVQTDQKILIGGVFTNYSGSGRTSLARLLPDGTLDSAFNPGSGP